MTFAVCFLLPKPIISLLSSLVVVVVVVEIKSSKQLFTKLSQSKFFGSLVRCVVQQRSAAQFSSAHNAFQCVFFSPFFIINFSFMSIRFFYSL